MGLFSPQDIWPENLLFFRALRRESGTLVQALFT